LILKKTEKSLRRKRKRKSPKSIRSEEVVVPVALIQILDQNLDPNLVLNPEKSIVRKRNIDLVLDLKEERKVTLDQGNINIKDLGQDPDQDPDHDHALDLRTGAEEIRIEREADQRIKREILEKNLNLIVLPRKCKWPNPLSISQNSVFQVLKS